MNWKKIILEYRKYLLYLIALVPFLLIGCSKVGRIVPEDNRLTLIENEISHGTFYQQGRLLRYSYNLKENIMLLNGRVYFHGGIDSLEIFFFFLDQSGTILQQKLIYYSGYRLTRSYGINTSFQETIDVPKGAIGFSFDFKAQYRSGRK